MFEFQPMTPRRMVMPKPGAKRYPKRHLRRKSEPLCGCGRGLQIVNMFDPKLHKVVPVYTCRPCAPES